MPGTGHSARYKGSISNRVQKSPFQQLAEWNAQLLGADGSVPTITGGGGGLAFKKLDASDIDGVMHNPATEDLDMNGFDIISNSSFNITSNGVLDISAAGLTLSSSTFTDIEATGTTTITGGVDVKVKSGTGNVEIIGNKMVTLKAGTAATEGIQIGTLTSQKIGFFGQTPKTRPTVFLPSYFHDMSGTVHPINAADFQKWYDTIENLNAALTCLIRALDHNNQANAGIGLLEQVANLSGPGGNCVHS